MTDDDLDLVETSALIDALKRRYDVIVIGMVKDLDDEREAREVYYRGGFTSALGITSFLDKYFAKFIGRDMPEAKATDDGE